MRRMHAPLDPECPEVEHFYESLDEDPMTAYSGVGTRLPRTSRPATGRRASAASSTGRRTWRSTVAEGPPPTRHGYEPHEVVSALQKAIRRGQVNAALYWAAEMEQSGYTTWLWKRLLMIASEDVGRADPTLVSTIRDLR